MEVHVRVTPDCATVAEYGTWRVTVAVGSGVLDPGSAITLSVVYHSQLSFHWQTTDPSGAGHVTATGPAGTAFSVDHARGVVRVELIAGAIVCGDEVTITLGDTTGGGPGLRMWPVAHDLEFELTVDPSGVQHSVRIPVLPGPMAKILVKCPSTVVAGEGASVLIRAVDAQGNTATAYDAALELRTTAPPDCVDLERGIARIPNVQVTEGARPGRVTVRDPLTDRAFASNAVEAVGEAEERIFWGDLHCHSSLAQALEPAEFLYAYARDEECLDFICHTEHDAGTEARWIGPRWRDWTPPVASVPEYVDATWEYRKELLRRHHDPGTFVALLGYEWASNLYGHMNVYYATDDAPIFYPDHFWQQDFTPRDLWDRLAGIDAFTIPHHISHRICSAPGGYVSGWDWRFYDPERVPLAEIYSKHGNSEYFGCPRAIGDQVPDGCVAEALRRGCRVGFVADTDTHASRPGSDLAGDLQIRQGGVTAVFAESLDRRPIFDALRNRRCYGTTGQRIVVRFSVNDAFMGEEVTLNDPAETKSVRFRIEGTDRIDHVAVVKNGDVAHRESPQSNSIVAEFVDGARTEATDCYYVRVVQADGEMAWSSPVWVGP